MYKKKKILYIAKSNNERGPFHVFQEGTEKRQLAKAESVGQ